MKICTSLLRRKSLANKWFRIKVRVRVRVKVKNRLVSFHVQEIAAKGNVPGGCPAPVEERRLTSVTVRINRQQVTGNGALQYRQIDNDDDDRTHRHRRLAVSVRPSLACNWIRCRKQLPSSWRRDAIATGRTLSPVYFRRAVTSEVFWRNGVVCHVVASLLYAVESRRASRIIRYRTHHHHHHHHHHQLTCLEWPK